MSLLGGDHFLSLPSALPRYLPPLSFAPPPLPCDLPHVPSVLPAEAVRPFASPQKFPVLLKFTVCLPAWVPLALSSASYISHALCCSSARLAAAVPTMDDVAGVVRQEERVAELTEPSSLKMLVTDPLWGGTGDQRTSEEQCVVML